MSNSINNTNTSTSTNISKPEQNLAKGVTLGILTVFIGSCLSVVAKHIGDQVTVSTIVLFQFGICFICTMPWVKKNGLGALKTRHPIRHSVRGVCGCLSFYAFYYALNHIPLVDAALLRHSAPLIVPLIILFWFNTAIPAIRWAALSLGFIGIAIVLKPGQHGMSFWHLIGLLSGVGLAFSMVLTRVLSQEEPEIRILFYYFLISLIFAIPFFIINYQPIPFTALPWLLLIGFGMYFAFIPYTRAYRYAKASVVAPTSYFSVLFAGVFDWIFWDYFPDIWTMVGVSLVLIAGFIIIKQGNEEQKAALTAQ